MFIYFWFLLKREGREKWMQSSYWLESKTIIFYTIYLTYFKSSYLQFIALDKQIAIWTDNEIINGYLFSVFSRLGDG